MLDVNQGYRFPRLDSLAKNTNELFVILAFSGGGTRAAALSYGVLEELDRVHLSWDPDKRSFCSTTCPSNAKTWTLLDEVDVISAVSGGSFTAAYYALHGKEIFADTSSFKEDFLHYPAQRDLVANLVFRPWNWKYLFTRVELAANQWASLFGDATYADLEKKKTRPYLILNSTDLYTKGRFEFTQEQFDLFCGDLSAFPLRRAVAASSAFPGLLTPMTIDSHVSNGCAYNPDWLTSALDMRTKNVNYVVNRRAQELSSYRDSTRQYFHVMDGGVADNLGLRAILQSLSWEAEPPDSQPVVGFNIAAMRSLSDQRKEIVAQNPRDTTFAGVPLIDDILIIAVDAGTNRTRDWGRRARPPWAGAVIESSAGIPVERLSGLSLASLRDNLPEADAAGEAEVDKARLHAFEVSLENIADDGERQYLENVETSFQLPASTVKCIVNRGSALLRGSILLGIGSSITFSDFVTDTLGGTIAEYVPEIDCRKKATADSTGLWPQVIGFGGYYALAGTAGYRRHLRGEFAMALRVVRPGGWGALFSVGQRHFNVSAPIWKRNDAVGIFGLWIWGLGPAYTFRFGRLGITPGFTAGYAFGSFEFEAVHQRWIADRYGIVDSDVSARGSWIAQGELHSWVDVTDDTALTAFGQYLLANPGLRIRRHGTILEPGLTTQGFRLGVGVSRRIH